MPREAEPTNVERAFTLEALQENVRIDGRAFDQFRNLDLSFGHGYGAANVQLGKTRYTKFLPRIRRCELMSTRIYAQISAEVSKPLEDRQFDGIFSITTELSPIASPAFEIGRYA